MAFKAREIGDVPVVKAVAAYAGTAAGFELRVQGQRQAP